MHSKRKIWIIAIVSLIVMVQLVVVFYAIPFVKVDNLLKTANNRTLSEIEEVFNDETAPAFISQSDYKKMHIVEDDLADEEYVKATTRKKVKFLNISTLEIICDTKVSVYNTNDIAPIREYNDVITITFAFKNGRWRVTSVNNHS